MACCFTGSQIWISNSSFKSLKQQNSTISRSISNNYSKSRSQAKYSSAQMLMICTDAPKLFSGNTMIWEIAATWDPWFLCAQQAINSWICHPFFGSVSFLLWLMKWLGEAVWTEWAKGLPSAWQKTAHSFLQEFVSYRFYSYVLIQ